MRSTIRVDKNGDFYYDINFDNLEVIKKDSFERSVPNWQLGASSKNPSFSANILLLWTADVNTFKKLLAGQIQWEEAEKELFEGIRYGENGVSYYNKSSASFL